MSTFRAWLRLIRVPALPTALADVWLGAAVMGYLFTWTAVWLSLISLALYAAGMILNDVHDVEEDRRDNPGRPVPSGQISRSAATAAGLALLAAAVLGAVMVGRLALAVAALLAVLVLTYDFVLKAGPLGPLNMGLCRAANVALGMAVAPSGMVREIPVNLFATVPIFVYIWSVTCLARHEATGANAKARLMPSLGVGLVVAGLAPLLIMKLSRLFAGVYDFGSVRFVGFYVLAGLAALGVAALVWRARNIRRTVTIALVGIIPLQAFVALAQFCVPEGACIMLLLIPVLLLRKLSHIT